MKNTTIKYGLIIGLAILLSEILVANNDYVSDIFSLFYVVLVFLLFIFLTNISIRKTYLENDKQITFFKGYVISLKIGIIGILFYQFLSLLQFGLFSVDLSKITNLLSTIQILFFDAFFKFFYLLILSFSVPSYYSRRSKDGSGMLDEDMLEQ